MRELDTIAYILGGGASAQEGAPTTYSLLDEAFWLFGGKSTSSDINLIGIMDEEDELSRYRDVFNALDQFYGTNLLYKMEQMYRNLHHPSVELTQKQVDIEDFFTRIDMMAKGKEDHGLNLSPKEIQALKRHAEYFFYHTLCINTGLITRIPHYLAFVDYVLTADNVHAVVTFNYDMLLERAMWDIPRRWASKYRNPMFNKGFFGSDVYPWSYALPALRADEIEYAQEARVYYLKLHGSFNFGLCPSTQDIILHQPVNSAGNYKRFYDREHKCNDGKDTQEALLIPPTRMKDLRIPSLKAIWEKAAELMRRTSEAHIIGYSLPPADEGAEQLIANNLNHGLQRLIVVNPDPSHRARLRTILDRCGDEVKEYETFRDYLELEFSAKMEKETG